MRVLKHSPAPGGPGRELTCERGLYEFLAGRDTDDLVETVERMAGPELLLSEQVWENNGKPTGSARPLLWAHAEYVKLLRSRRDRHPFERSPVVHGRYAGGHRPAPQVWTRDWAFPELPAGDWRILAGRPFRLRWSPDGWASAHDTPSRACDLGLHWVDLQSCPLQFTFYWTDAERWEGRDYGIKPGEAGNSSARSG